MKKLLAISLIVAGTFASVGVASAGSIVTDGYTGWASQAMDNGTAR